MLATSADYALGHLRPRLNIGKATIIETSVLPFIAIFSINVSRPNEVQVIGHILIGMVLNEEEKNSCS